MDENKPCRCGHSFHTEKGFTLMELLVVCALLGILVSLTLPSLRHAIFNDPLKSVARKAIGFIGGVREQALHSREPYFIHINRSENRLWSQRDSVGAAVERPATKELKIPEGIRIREVVSAGRDLSAEEQVSVWITRQGFMHETSVQFEDSSGQTLMLQFPSFVDSVQIREPDAKLVR